MDSKIENLINDQINAEFYSGYLYMAFANYYEEAGFSGYANFYMIQAAEERDHALIMRKYLQENGAHVRLEAIEEPTVEFNNFIEPLEAGLAHEKYITSRIDEIYAVASELRDYRTLRFLDWFIAEQTEEETNAQEVLDKAKLFGTTPQGMYALDNEQKMRVYQAPAILSK